MAKLQGLSKKELVVSIFNQLSQRERLPGEWPEEDEENESESEYLHQRYLENVQKEVSVPGVVRKIAALIFDPLYFRPGTAKSLPVIKAKISEAMGYGKFDEEMLSALVRPRSFVATRDLISLVYEKWSRPPVDLFARLVAMNRACILEGQEPGEGYEIVEVQGKYSPEGQIVYARIQSVEAREEKEFAKRAQHPANF